MSEPKLSSAGADWTKLLMDQELIPHLGTLLQAYRDAPPEKREEILLETLKKIKSKSAKAKEAAPVVSEKEAAPAVSAKEVPMPPPEAKPSATPPFEPEAFTRRAARIAAAMPA